MTPTLEQAFTKAAALPVPKQDAFAKFLLDELVFLGAVDEGECAADLGAVTPIEEVRKMIPTWISESSSPSRRS